MPDAPNPRWEYRTSYNMRDADLADYGSKGWELVTVTPDRCHFWKRPAGRAASPGTNPNPSGDGG